MSEVIFAVLVSLVIGQPGTALIALQEGCKGLGGEVETRDAVLVAGGENGTQQIPMVLVRCLRRGKGA